MRLAHLLTQVDLNQPKSQTLCFNIYVSLKYKGYEFFQNLTNYPVASCEIIHLTFRA